MNKLHKGDLLFVTGLPQDCGYTFVYQLTGKTKSGGWKYNFWSANIALIGDAREDDVYLEGRPKLSADKALMLLTLWGYTNVTLEDLA